MDFAFATRNLIIKTLKVSLSALSLTILHLENKK